MCLTLNELPVKAACGHWPFRITQTCVPGLGFSHQPCGLGKLYVTNEALTSERSARCWSDSRLSAHLSKHEPEHERCLLSVWTRNRLCDCVIVSVLCCSESWPAVTAEDPQALAHQL